ncbi:MmgE/PrpD family protein [Vreelandella titanicae]
MQTITQDLARYASSLELTEIPTRARDAARIGMTDCVATMIAGRNEHGPRAIAALLGNQAEGRRRALCIVDGRMLTPADAALANGTAGHVLDYDDVALSGHPSAVLTPAILALGTAHGVSGATAIRAYAAGYEVWAALQSAKPGQLHDVGLHPTAVLGTVAVAAACSVILNSDSKTSAHALAISASLAAGLTVNFGTMTKAFQVGRAAQSGVMAAELAANGFTGAPDVFEHPRGFLVAMSAVRDGTDRFALPRGADRLADTGVNVKRYPTCYATHRAIDAMLELTVAHDLAPEDVQLIEVEIGESQHRMLRNPVPRTGLEARFSIEFAMAAALVARCVGLGQLQDDFVLREDVQYILSKVRVTTTDARMEGDETFAPADRVRVMTVHGRQLDHSPVTHAHGSWQNPLTEVELAAKFIDCTARDIGKAAATALFKSMMGLERVASIGDLPLFIPEFGKRKC